jgi:hypothetical protein
VSSDVEEDIMLEKLRWNDLVVGNEDGFVREEVAVVTTNRSGKNRATENGRNTRRDVLVQTGMDCEGYRRLERSRTNPTASTGV